MSAVVQTFVFSLLITVPFGFHHSLSQGLTEAENSGKPLILYFKSENCPTCPAWDAWFGREDVKKVIEQTYVAVAIDIEDFDGKACKEIYQVQSIPAVVVVDKNGNILYREENSLREQAFYQFLQNPEAQAIAKPKPKDAGNPQVISSPQTKGEASQAPSAESQSSAQQGKYFVQTGYFGSVENAQNMKVDLASRGFAPVVLKEEKKQGQTFTRVLLGAFRTQEEADKYLRALEASGIQAKLYF